MKVLRFKNKSDKKAEIVLYGDIGESFWFDSISANAFHEMLKELPKNLDELDVRINSGGGDVFDGFTIYNRLKQLNVKKKTIYVDAIAASIASVIALAGDEVVMGDGAQFMIHKPWTMTAGNSTHLESVIDRLDDIENSILNIYARKSSLSRDEIKLMMADERYMLADEAIEFGFADRMAVDDEDLRVAASVKDSFWLRNKPNNLISEKEIIDERNKEIDDFLNSINSSSPSA